MLPCGAVGRLAFAPGYAGFVGRLDHRFGDGVCYAFVEYRGGNVIRARRNDSLGVTSRAGVRYIF